MNKTNEQIAAKYANLGALASEAALSRDETRERLKSLILAAINEAAAELAPPAYVPKVGEYFYARRKGSDRWHGPYDCRSLNGGAVNASVGRSFDRAYHAFAPCTVSPPPAIGGAT